MKITEVSGLSVRIRKRQEAIAKAHAAWQAKESADARLRAQIERSGSRFDPSSGISPKQIQPLKSVEPLVLTKPLPKVEPKVIRAIAKQREAFQAFHRESPDRWQNALHFAITRGYAPEGAMYFPADTAQKTYDELCNNETLLIMFDTPDGSIAQKRHASTAVAAVADKKEN